MQDVLPPPASLTRSRIRTIRQHYLTRAAGRNRVNDFRDTPSYPGRQLDPSKHSVMDGATAFAFCSIPEGSRDK